MVRTPLSPLAVTVGTFSCRAAWQGPVLRGALLKQSLIIVCRHVSTLWCRSQPRKEGVSWGRVPPTSSIHPHQDAASKD